MALDTNLTHYYKFDESSGAIEDEVGTSDGTNQGGTQGATGKISNAIDFVGPSSEYATLPDGVVAQDNFTISFWVYKDNFSSGDSNHVTLSQWDDNSGNFRSWYITTSSTGVGFNSSSDGTNESGNSVNGTTTLNADTWYHVVVTKNGTTGKVFVDGVLRGINTSIPSTLYNYSGVVRMARALWGGADRYSTVRVDELGIWTRAINDGSTTTVGNTAGEEVASLYNSGSGVTYPFSTQYSFTKTGNARILIEDNSLTKSGQARIKIVDNTQVYDATARIKIEQSFTKTGNAAIEIQDNQFTKDGNARILIQDSFDKSANARILKQGSFDKVGNAYILRGGIFDVQGNARILIENNQFTKTGNARILQQGSFDKTGNARVVFQSSFTKDGNAKVIFRETFDKTGNARILQQSSFEKIGNARILIEGNSFTKTGNALITFMNDFTKTGNASILINDRFQPTVRVAEHIKPRIKSVETFN